MFTQELINITIDHYRIERGLARGGMSEVYLARDLRNDQIVAMKMVKRSAGEYYERFLREAKAMMRLRHPHILPALDSGSFQHWAYMISPYIEGGTLTQHLINGPLPLERATLIFDQVASALQYAHDQGILHRDIKSSNVLLQNETCAYLTDFGLVKSTEDEYSLTRSGFLIGTPEYMAPELIDCDANPLSDIYSLGVLLYQMVTGTLPFKGPNPVAIVMKHLNEFPVPPSTLNPLLPRDAEHIILQTLDKDPQRRFRTASALANAFRQSQNSVAPILDIAGTIPYTPEGSYLPGQQAATVNIIPQTAANSQGQRSVPALKLNLRTGLIVGGIVILLIILLWLFTNVFTTTSSSSTPPSSCTTNFHCLLSHQALAFTHEHGQFLLEEQSPRGAFQHSMVVN